MVKLPHYLFWIALLFCWPTLLLADEPMKDTYVAEFSGNRIFIMPDPCPLGGWFERWGKARWLFRGETYEACWKIQQDQQGMFVYTVDTEGDIGTIPLALFKKDEGV